MKIIDNLYKVVENIFRNFQTILSMKTNIFRNFFSKAFSKKYFYLNLDQK